MGCCTSCLIKSKEPKIPNSIDIVPPSSDIISTSAKSSGKKLIEANNNNTNHISTDPVIEVYSPILISSASPLSNVLSTENVANLPNASIAISSPESAQESSNNLIGDNIVYTTSANNNSNKNNSDRPSSIIITPRINNVAITNNTSSFGSTSSINNNNHHIRYLDDSDFGSFQLDEPIPSISACKRKFDIDTSQVTSSQHKEKSSSFSSSHTQTKDNNSTSADDYHNDDSVSVNSAKSTHSLTNSIQARMKQKSEAKRRNSRILDSAGSSGSSSMSIDSSSKINASSKSVDASSPLKSVEAMITTPPEKIIPLSKEGYMQKQGAMFKVFTTRYFVLHRGVLYDYENMQESTTTASKKTAHMRKKEYCLCLLDYQCIKNDDAKQLRLECHIIDESGSTTNSNRSMNSNHNNDKHSFSAKIASGFSASVGSLTSHSHKTGSVDVGESHKSITLYIKNDEEYYRWSKAFTAHIAYANGQ